MRTDNHRFLIWGGPLELVLAVLAIAAWLYFPHRYIHRYSPAVRRDLRAAATAWRPGDTREQTVRRYFETGFGPLTNPTNRQKVFLSFFDPELLAARFELMSRTPLNENKANVATVARWIADYRASLSPQEKSALRSSLLSPDGQARVQQAMAEYERLNADCRGVTAPAFFEMMATLKTLKTQ